MPYYLVLGSKKRPIAFGGSFLDWNDPGIIGVFPGNTAEDACRAAAAQQGSMGTMFAIEGFATGLAFLEDQPQELGRTGSGPDRLVQALARMEERSEKIDRLLLERSRIEDDDE